jgi:hypothetical protein
MDDDTLEVRVGIEAFLAGLDEPAGRLLQRFAELHRERMPPEVHGKLLAAIAEAANQRKGKLQ